MKKCLELLNKKYGCNSVYSIRIFTDKSGRIYDSSSKIIFEFKNIKHLKKYLNK